MSVIIPAPKKHDDVAVNQHMVPRCYMKAWGYNSKKTSVWIYDKLNRFKGHGTSDWTIESKPTTGINTLNCFHDLKAGFMYMPHEALEEIFAPLLDFLIIDDEKLDSVEKLNAHYYNFLNWKICDKSGLPFTQEEKDALQTYLKESRYTFVETEWAHTYENDWGKFIDTFYQKVCTLRTEKDSGMTLSSIISSDDISKLIRYSVIYNWRSIEGNEFFNEALNTPIMDVLKEIDIPADERVYSDDQTAADEFIHCKRIKDFIEFLRNDAGLIKKCIDGYALNTVPYIYLTDTSHPFITSNEPSFTHRREDGFLETIFVSLPTMLVAFGRGKKGSFFIERATYNKVDMFNRIIARRGNLLIVPNQKYDVSKLLVENP